MKTNRSNVLQPTGVDAVVELAPGCAGVQADSGEFVLRERLGPGIVREIVEGSRLRVHWVEVDVDTWVEPADVKALDPATRLLVIYRRNSDGTRKLERYKVVNGATLTHNWTVEWFPKNVIRTVRSDDLAWTFDWYRGSSGRNRFIQSWKMHWLKRITPRLSLWLNLLLANSRTTNTWHNQAMSVHQMAENNQEKVWLRS